MKVYYDLHIHSTLSACGSELLTPNNILNMCMLKKLNMISITDHNTLKHLYSFSKIIDSYDFLFIYGVEVTVKEGFHVLGYFKTLEQALIFDSILEDSNPKIFYNNQRGSQLIYNEYDELIEEIPYQLNVPLNLTLQEMIEEVKKLNGITVLAHIDRAFGILEYYPDFTKFNIDAVEINNIDNIMSLHNKYQYLKKYPYLHSSDAHNLLSIHERAYSIILNSLSFEGLKEALRYD